MADESFIRWQGRTIEQFGYAVNLFLMLSTASLGFGVNLILQHKAQISCEGWALIPIGCFLLLFSIFIGIATVINRLYDFRLTTQIARKREKDGKKEILETLRNKEKFHSRATWNLFWTQAILFGLGVLVFCIATFLRCHCN